MDKIMTTLEVHSLVRIARQPKRQMVQLVGERGVILEIKDGYADVRCYCVSGGWGGGGWVDLDCLELDGGADLKAAHEAYEAKEAIYRTDCERRGNNWRAKFLQVSKKYGITLDQVREIYHELHDYDDSYPPKEE